MPVAGKLSSMMESQFESPSESLLSGYAPPGVCDEMCAADGSLRAPWQGFVQGLQQLGAQGWGKHFDRMRRLLRENGVNHSIAGSPQDRDGHGELDPIPWLLAKHEWLELAAGLEQRVRLLNRLLADLYGPQEMLRQGVVPPGLVFRHAGYLLPCHGILPPQGIFLHLYASELVRGPDGRWLVLADRTQGPSGAGFAIENRVVLSRTLPDHFHSLHVERLAPFFLTLAGNVELPGAARPRQPARRPVVARPVGRRLLRGRVPGSLPGLHAGRRRRLDGPRPPRVLEDAGRTVAGGRHLAPGVG